MLLPIELSDLREATPTLLSLAIIEILLSMDRLLEVSEAASHLPATRRQPAIELGGFLADLARLSGLFLAAPIISKFLVAKVLGAFYLLEMMSSHFVAKHAPGVDPKIRNWSFLRTVLGVALLDLTFSIGNIVASLSLTKQVWIVACSGIFWMTFSRLFSGSLMILYRRFPMLRNNVPILAGGIGVLLLVEVLSKQLGLSVTTPWQQFAGLVSIVLLTAVYDLFPALQRRVDPILKEVGLPVARLLNRFLSFLFWPVRTLLGNLVAR